MLLRSKLRVAAIGALLTTAVLAQPASAQTPPPQPLVSLAVPAYFTDSASWEKVINTPEVRFIVAHPDTPEAGKPYVADKDLTANIDKAIAKGKIVSIYVTAGYDKVAFDVVLTRVASALQAYPKVKAVFLDEINYDQCDKYKAFAAGSGSVKGFRDRFPDVSLQLNPGAPILNCYEGLADSYLNLERPLVDPNGVPAWLANVNLPGNVPYYEWMFSAANRNKIWQMVHSVPANQIVPAIDAALTRNASVLFLTTDIMPNPYDKLPDDAAWNAMISHIADINSGKVALPATKQLTKPAAAAAPAPQASTTVKKAVTTKKKVTTTKKK